MKSFVSVLTATLMICASLLCLGGCTRISTDTGAEVPKDPVEAWKEPVTVPAEAVLPPVRKGVGECESLYKKLYDYAEAYEKADAVCIVTVGNWLEDNSVCCYFEAEVNKTYKGELPDRIVLRQNESKDSNRGAPIFTYGNRLLVFLGAWDNWEGEGEAYYQIGSDLTTLYYTNTVSGNDYLIDLHGLTGDLSRKLGVNDIMNPELAAQISSELKNSDEALADAVSLYSHDDPPTKIKIYSFDEFETFIDSMKQRGSI